ncbi:MAG: hypothetical protein WKF97_08105 [Chitinophagaceae bacterium]
MGTLTVRCAYSQESLPFIYYTAFIFLLSSLATGSYAQTVPAAGPIEVVKDVKTYQQVALKDPSSRMVDVRNIYPALFSICGMPPKII